MRGPVMSFTLLSITVGFTETPVVAAEVVHEWSFESSEPFHDSVAGVKLNPTWGVERVEVQDGPPSAHGHAIALPGKDEALLISPAVASLADSFQIELEFRMAEDSVSSPMTLAQQGLFHRADLLGWALQLVPATDGSTDPAVVHVLLSDGQRIERVVWSLAPTPGIDYRLTAAIDLEHGEARLRLQPLDEALPAAGETRPITVKSLNSKPVKVFCAGDSTGRMATFPFHGLMHRIVLLRGVAAP